MLATYECTSSDTSIEFSSNTYIEPPYKKIKKTPKLSQYIFSDLELVYPITHLSLSGFSTPWDIYNNPKISDSMLQGETIYHLPKDESTKHKTSTYINYELSSFCEIYTGSITLYSLLIYSAKNLENTYVSRQEIEKKDEILNKLEKMDYHSDYENVVDISEQLAEECLLSPKGLKKINLVLSSGKIAKKVKIEVLTAMSDYEVTFDDQPLTETLKKLAMTNEKDMAFFSAYTLAIGNHKEAAKFLEILKEADHKYKMIVEESIKRAFKISIGEKSG